MQQDHNIAVTQSQAECQPRVRRIRKSISRQVACRVFAILCAVLPTLAVIIAPAPAEAGVASSVARRAMARGTSGAPQKAFGKRAFDKPHDVVIDRAKHPQAAAHIDHAQSHGQPTILHVERRNAAGRRGEAVGNVNPRNKPAPGYERDEYPPAFTREGGHNANVRFISPHDNRGAGASMGAQTRDLPDGAKIRVLVR
jgi:hypothetical protein